MAQLDEIYTALGAVVYRGVAVHCDKRPVETPSDSIIQFLASGMVGFDAVMADNKPPVLDGMQNDGLCVGFDGADDNSIVIVGERQLPRRKYDYRCRNKIFCDIVWILVLLRLFSANCGSSSRASRVAST